METKHRTWTLTEIAALLGGRAEGPEDLVLSRPVTAGSDDPEGITFAESKEAVARVRGSSVGAVLLGDKDEDLGRPAIRVPNVRAAFNALLELARKPIRQEVGVHPAARIGVGAKIDPTASIGAFTVVAENATIRAGVVIHPLCYVGEDCEIGEGTVLYPRVVLVQGVKVGKRCILHPGVVLGADGFGYFWAGDHHQKVPQVGNVELGDDVEIGANSTIDRATCGTTRIGNGTKIDNLVQLGHNCQVGNHVIIAGHTGISGSATFGDGVILGGQVAVRDHVTIASGAILAGRTGVMNDIDQPGTYWGTPAKPIGEEMKIQAVVGKLPELMRRIRALEKELETLKKS